MGGLRAALRAAAGLPRGQRSAHWRIGGRFWRRVCDWFAANCVGRHRETMARGGDLLRGNYGILFSGNVFVVFALGVI